MDAFKIHGGTPLRGTVTASGSKNAALPILAASLLTDEPIVLEDVPRLSDVSTQLKILKPLGVRHEWTGPNTLRLQCTPNDQCEAPYELVRQMRASICVLGPLLARRGRARVSMPGGCVIGSRPIDLHLKGLDALGAKLPIQHGYVEGTAKRLRGASIYLAGAAGSSVLATANVAMAATLAEGTTVIEGAALEPEVEDLLRCLAAMGARIDGIGTPRLSIHGVKSLRGTTHRVIPDRIEAGTFLIAAAATRGEVEVRRALPRHLGALLDRFHAIGVPFEAREDSIRVMAAKRLRPSDTTTLPFPGFPTDLQAQLMTLLCQADGISLITERIYPDRFMHVQELARMGAKIRLLEACAIVEGCGRLSGAPVMASDLRASAALVVAALSAEGESTVHRVYHIDRGYDRIVDKLGTLGARIERFQEKGP